MPNRSQTQGGILLRGASFAAARDGFLQHAVELGIDRYVEAIEDNDRRGIRFRLIPALQRKLAPACDTLRLCERFNLHPVTIAADLEKEILLAMLLGPVTFEFPSYAELAASISIRQYIVEASRHTTLNFHTSKIERPTDYWAYSEESGFTVLPGKSLIEALRMATQPEVSGQQYSFSCYRATEYVILLGITQELATCNPALLRRIQHQWETRAIQSGQFHDVFLREYGSMSEPIPQKYYVPGDRVWFRNPDERSSDVTGYEGSWVFYLGGGLFTNLWMQDKPFSLDAKCVELYHWRSGIFKDAEGKLRMDEAVIKERVRASMEDPVELGHILDRMMRLRDPSGVYADGGCIDTTREYPRYVCPGTSDIILPDK